MVVTSLPAAIGKPKAKAKIRGVFAQSSAINILSVARIALFAARDVWFVVSVPVFLGAVLGWTFLQIGTFLALWVIGYGIVQAASPALLGTLIGDRPPPPALVGLLGLALAAVVVAIILGLRMESAHGRVILAGLGAFGVVFALNSAVHSYLVLAYARDALVGSAVSKLGSGGCAGGLGDARGSRWRDRVFFATSNRCRGLVLS
jgi:hypothetical protein